MPPTPSRNLLPLLPLAFALALPAACSAPTPPVPEEAATRTERTAPPAAATTPAAPSAAAPVAVPQAATDSRPDQKPSPGVKWADATIPAGTAIVAALQTRIDSGSAQSGSIVRAVTDAAVVVGDLEALPAGSTFDGFIGQVIPANEKGEGGGTVALRWRLVRTPVGSAAAIKAEVVAAEAASGGSPGLTIAGPEPVVEGSFGGTVLAAGVKGEELVLERGTRLTLVLSDPVPIKVRL